MRDIIAVIIVKEESLQKYHTYYYNTYFVEVLLSMIDSMSFIFVGNGS